VDGELGGQPLAQQSGAPALHRVVGLPQRVQLRQGAPVQLGLGLQPGGREVRQAVVAGPAAQRGGHDRVEVADGLDVAIGEGARGVCGGGHRIRSSRADMVGRRGSPGAARSIAYISAPSTIP
jgi:hypothetical protein